MNEFCCVDCGWHVRTNKEVTDRRCAVCAFIATFPEEERAKLKKIFKIKGD